TYTKFYDSEKLKKYEAIFEEFQGKKYSDFVNIPQNKKHFYSEKYLNSPIIFKSENGINLHFEFDFILFYQLLNSQTKGIEKMVKEFANKLQFYYDKNEDEYNIPYESYQAFYNNLDDEEIKSAINVLVRTNTFVIL